MQYPSISSALQAHRNYAVQKFTDDTDTEIDNNTSTHTSRHTETEERKHTTTIFNTLNKKIAVHAMNCKVCSYCVPSCYQSLANDLTTKHTV